MICSQLITASSFSLQLAHEYIVDPVDDSKYLIVYPIYIIYYIKIIPKIRVILLLSVYRKTLAPSH